MQLQDKVIEGFRLSPNKNVFGCYSKIALLIAFKALFSLKGISKKRFSKQPYSKSSIGMRYSAQPLFAQWG